MEEKTKSEKNKIIPEDCYRQFQEWEKKICDLHSTCVRIPTEEEMLDQNNVIAYYYNSIEFWASQVPTTIHVNDSNCIIDSLTQLKFRWGQIRLAIVYRDMEHNNITNDDLRLHKLGLDIYENN